MYLYLMRHGEAQAGLVDSERVLTSRGEQQVQEQAVYLANQQLAIGTIYHSDYTRAAQTAKILSQYIHPNVLQHLNGLHPQDDVENLLSQIDGWTQPTLLVGHLPHLAYLVYALCRTEVEFKPATLVVVQRKTRGSCLQALRHPKG